MTDHLRVNGHLIDDLSSAARHGGAALADAPALLRRVLEDEAWREFVTQRGDHVSYARFSDFVTTAPLKGLGVDMGLVERIVGTGDRELLTLLKKAKAGRPGRPRKGETPCESQGVYGGTDYLAERLSDDHPEVAARIDSGELTINAAAVLAGIRPRRISVRLDNPRSIAQSLRKHLTAEQVAELRALLDSS